MDPVSNVLKFPTGPLEENLSRRFNDWFTRMRALGLSDQEIQDELIGAAKAMGGVEHDGVWYIGCSPDSANGDNT